MLEVREISVYYGQALAIESVSITVDPGEVVAVLGANGAGKSTLVNAIAGLLPVRSGSIRLDGEELTGHRPHEIVGKGLALVPEGRRLFNQLTVRQNLELGAYSVKDRAVVAQALDTVHELFPILADRAEQLAGTLSGGQQQMVAIGRALMAKPRYLLFDEPSLGLAPVIVDDIFGLIERVRDLGIAVLLVEQNVGRTLEICHRGYVLSSGRLVLSGSREELLASAAVRQAYLAM
jgi:branched-chain amino acid transport system ATP-binding protein